MTTPLSSAAMARRILDTVRQIPRGQVATYGWIAERAGFPRHARLVGHTLRQSSPAARLPWHRVINSQGRISFPRGSDAHAEQRRRLEREGVIFVGGRVNLRKFGWRMTLDELLWKPTAKGFSKARILSASPGKKRRA